MRKVDRSKVKEPPILKSPFGRSGESEIDRLIQYYHTKERAKKPGFKRYKEYTVKLALKQLFHGKCAYCEGYFEDKHPVDVEHYRPKGSVANTDHSGYWWLAADWENLLPSCIDCNRSRNQEILDIDPDSDLAKLLYGDRINEFRKKGRISMGKKDAFLLEKDSPRARYDEDSDVRAQDLEKEERLLIDPTRDDPEDFITFEIPDFADSTNNQSSDRYSLVLPMGKDGKLNKKGQISSLVYGLNRLGLVKARTRLLRDLDFLWEMCIKLRELQNTVDNRKKNVSQADQPFFERLGSALKQMDSDIIEKIRKKAQPEAPYSALVRAWINARIEE